MARGPAGTTGQKRKTEPGPTPPQATKKNMKPKWDSSSCLVTFEQAEKDLLGVVPVQGNPYQILTNDQIAWLHTTLGNRVDAVIDSDAAFIPRFTEPGVRNGRLTESFSWLASLLGTLERSDGQAWISVGPMF